MSKVTAEQMIKILEKEVGTKEDPAKSNKVKYNTMYYGKEVSGSAYPWCCAFLWCGFHEAGASDLFYGGKKTAHCETLRTYHKKKGQQVTKDYKPGDVIFFNFSGKTKAEHVGMCVDYNKAKGTITTVDGNTGTNNEANGGAVMYRTRSIKYVLDGYRPDYKTSGKENDDEPDRTYYDIKVPLLVKGDEGDDVKSLQILLTGYKCSTKGFDGKFGPNTEKALKKYQASKGLEEDGKCGPQVWRSFMRG